MTTEIIFYAIGFVSCLLFMAIVVEVNEKDRKNKRALRRSYRTQLDEQIFEKAKEDIDIDVKIN